MSDQGKIQQNVKEAKYVATSGTSSAAIYINNYYREEVKVEPRESDEASTESLPCPYRGLFHFEPKDAEFFFGRETFIEELYSSTKTRNFIPVLGASGSGKSSVVLAGIVPKLEKEGHWQFTYFRPSSNPFNTLAQALVPLYTPTLDDTDQIKHAHKLGDYLCKGETPLSAIIARIKQNHPQNRLLLIADQFEEIYTLCKDEKIRRSFLDMLLDCFQSPADNSTVLLATMRVDFLGNALSYPPIADVLKNSASLKLIGSMNHEELSQVIEKPAGKLKVTFEAGLVERILHDVEDQPGNLPLLEFALTELWNKRTGKHLTHKIYEEIGQVEGALARYADEKYDNFEDAEKQKVQRIFIQLVRPGEGVEDTRRIAIRTEFEKQSWSLVTKLANDRLVVTSRSATNQETVEIVHEALIRNWGELRIWMNKHRVFRAWQERLRSAIGQWIATNRDPGSLLRGLALAEAEEKLEERPGDLDSEAEFIRRSIQERVRREKEEKDRHQLELFYRQVSGQIVRIRDLLPIKPVDALVQAIQSVGSCIDLGQLSGNTFYLIKERLEDATKLAREQNVFKGHEGAVTCVAVSPDGKLIASSSKDDTVRLWDTQGNLIGKPIEEHKGAVYAVSFSPDGKFIASGGEDGAVFFCDTQGNLIGQLFPNKRNKKEFSFQRSLLLLKHFFRNFESNFLASIKMFFQRSVLLLKLFLRDPWGTLSSLLWALLLLALMSSILYILIISNTNIPNFLKILVLVCCISTLLVPPIWWFSRGFKMKGAVTSVAFSPDGKYLITGHEDKKLRLWNKQRHKWNKQRHKWDKQYNLSCMPFQGHQGSITSASFSRDGKQIISAGLDTNFQLWNLWGWRDKRRCKFSRKSKFFSIIGIPLNVIFLLSLLFLFGKDFGLIVNLNLILIFFTFFAILFRYFNPQETQIDQGAVTSVAFSPDGQAIVSGSRDRTVRLWDRQGNPIFEPFKGHENDVTSVAFSPDGQTIVSGSSDGTVRLWDIRNDDYKNWGDCLQLACNRLRYHPILKNPQTDVEKKACKTCSKREEIVSHDEFQ